MRWIAALLLFQSCAAAPADVPAVIDRPSPESRAELARVVSAALEGAPVRLADDALTHDSVLIIEKAHTGRDLDRPERFHLMKAGTHCVLVHERTSQRWTLVSTTCRGL